MNNKEYLAKRNAMMDEIQGLIDSQKLDEANLKMEDVKTLDTEYDNCTKALANMNALKENQVITNLSDKSVKVIGTVLTAMEDNKEDSYVNAFAKKLMGKELSDSENEAFKMMNVTMDTTNTQILIPDTIVSGIWKEVGELYPLYADVYKTNVKGTLTVLSSEESTDASWYEEGTKVTDGFEKFAKATLNGCELSRSITVSWKLKEMAVNEFIPFLQSQLAEKMGIAAAYGTFKGKGKAAAESEEKDEPMGIKTSLLAEATKSQIITLNVGDELTYETITSMIAKVKGTYKVGSKFYATSDFIWNKLAGVKDGTGRPIFISDATAGGVGRLFGFIVEEDDSVDTLLFGNASKGYHLNINKPIILDQEDHKKDRETDYIAYGIMDGNVRTRKAFSYLEVKKA